MPLSSTSTLASLSPTQSLSRRTLPKSKAAGLSYSTVILVLSVNVVLMLWSCQDIISPDTVRAIALRELVDPARNLSSSSTPATTQDMYLRSSHCHPNNSRDSPESQNKHSTRLLDNDETVARSSVIFNDIQSSRDAEHLLSGLKRDLNF